MAKFSTIARGKRARLLVDLPMLDGQTVAAALVPLFGDDEAEVLSAARLFAKVHGVEKPEPGEPLYERGLWLHTVLRTVMDSDVPDKMEPFFANAEEILRFLDPDRIAMIFGMQRAWQMACAPPPGKMNDIDFIRHVVELSEAGEEEARTGKMRIVPFDNLPDGTRARFSRSLARQLLSWVSISSLSGSPTPADSGSTPSSSSPAPTPAPASPTSPSEELEADPSPAVVAAGDLLIAQLEAETPALAAADTAPSTPAAEPSAPIKDGSP